MAEWPAIAEVSDVSDAWAQLPAVVGFLDALRAEAGSTYLAPKPGAKGLALDFADMAVHAPGGLLWTRSQVEALVKARDAQPRLDVLVTGEFWRHQSWEGMGDPPLEPGQPRMTAVEAARAYWTAANTWQLLRERQVEGRSNDRAGRKALSEHLAQVLFPDLLQFTWYGDPLLQATDPHQPLGPAFTATVLGHSAAMAAWDNQPPPPAPPTEPPGPSWWQ